MQPIELSHHSALNERVSPFDLNSRRGNLKIFGGWNLSTRTYAAGQSAILRVEITGDPTCQWAIVGKPRQDTRQQSESRGKTGVAVDILQ